MSNDEELAALRKLARAVARHGELDERARVVVGCGELIDMARDALKFKGRPRVKKKSKEAGMRGKPLRCLQCDSEGSILEPTLGGMRRRPCPSCNARPRIKCFQCKGLGSHTELGGSARSVCSNCDGSGEVPDN